MKFFNVDGTFASPFGSGEGELRRLTLRGTGATLVAGGVTLAIQVIATMVLARLLMPSDFGLVTMVTTFSLLLANFGFNGLTEAIVQCDDMNHALASSLFWINATCGAVLTIAFAEAGSLLAKFYHDAPVQPVAVGISLSIFATCISTVHLALLKRAMRFSWVSTNDICARAVSVFVSILLAWMGWGYWALVAGAVSLPISTSVGAFFVCRWIPGIPRRVPSTGSVLSFALNAYGNFGVNYVSRNVDNLLVGWRFDARSLGFYKKAYDLFALSANQLVSSIAVVVVTALSRVRRHPEVYRRYLLDTLAVMAFVGMGCGAGFTLAGKDLIYVLLGPKWGTSGLIFTFFGPGIGAMILYGTHGWIHLSLGRADRWFRWAILEFAVTFLLFIAGLHWGPIGIATAWSVSFWVLTIPAIWYAGQPIGLNIAAVVSVVWRYVTASLVAVSATILVETQVPSVGRMAGPIGAFFRLATVPELAAILYVGTVVLLHGGLAPLLQIASLLHEMIQSGKKLINDASTKLDSGMVQGAGRSVEILPNGLPLVSVLIPAYNAQEWVADTIRSAIAQTWPRIEIIVVDDGSKDATLAIARQFESQGVRVVTQKNQGASAARNTAFAQSHGDYIQWLDADDLLASDKISKQVELVMQGLSQRTVLSCPWGHFMYRPHRANFTSSALWSDLSPKEWLLRKMEQNVFMQTASWLVSRSVTKAAGPWDVKLLGDDDGEYFCRVLLASDGIRFVPDARVYYRAFRFDGLSYIGRFPNKIEAHWRSMQLHIRYLRSLGEDARVNAACLQYLRDSLIYFYPEVPHIVRQAEELAVELGASLGRPVLTWKYSWLEKSLGWATAKRVQHVMRRARWRLAKRVDRLLNMIECQEKERYSQRQSEADLADGNLESLVAKESQAI